MTAILKTIAIIVISTILVQAQDMDVCQLWRQGGGHWWSSASVYCCKKCCLTTLSAASECTQQKCKGCAAGDEGQCQNNFDSVSKKFFVTGCADSEYCRYAPADNNDATAGEPVRRGDYHCAEKQINNATCENDSQCHSGRCLLRQPLRRNFCYNCIASNNEKSDTYGAELTNHCDAKKQYCSDQTFACETKLGAGEKCYGNHFMCKSNICSGKYDICVACAENTDCNKGLQCSPVGHCEESIKEAGEKCIETRECERDHICTNKRC